MDEVLGDLNNKMLMLGNGKADDMGLEWFMLVGSVVSTTICVQIVSTTAPPIATGIVKALLRKRKPASMNSFSQGALNEIYTNPDFNLALRFAQTLNVIFMIVMYSPGLPFLNFVGAGYCFVSFWVDKIALLRYATKPPQYDEGLVKSGLKILPYAALLHVMLGLWTFANQRILPSDWAAPVFQENFEAEFSPEDVEEIHRIWWEGSDGIEDYQLKVAERIFSFARAASIFHLFGFICLGVVYLIIGSIVGKVLMFFLGPLFKCIWVVIKPMCKCRKTSTDKVSGTEETYLASKDTMPNVNSYLMDKNPAYSPAYKAICEVVANHDDSPKKGSQNV